MVRYPELSLVNIQHSHFVLYLCTGFIMKSYNGIHIYISLYYVFYILLLLFPLLLQAYRPRQCSSSIRDVPSRVRG